MSRKSKRTKQLGRAKQPGQTLQLQPGPLVLLPQAHEQSVSSTSPVRQQILKGDFTGTIRTCKSLLHSLPKGSAQHIEILALLGLAYGMVQHHQESYDVFSEALTIAPTMPELWYNHGLASSHLGHFAEAVRDYERAVELLKDDTSEVAHKIAKELERGRQELQEAMEPHGEDITLEEYIEREERFTQALNLIPQQKWQEAEQLFRQLAELGTRIPSYWGNLGVCLMAQGRYDEAEEALKQALALDPDYSFALDNLRKLPEARRGKIPLAVEVITLTPEEKEATQTLTIYEHGKSGAMTSTTVESKGNAVTPSVWKQIGKQPPRYSLFTNHYKDIRFIRCPSCRINTRPRKFCLVIKVHPTHTIILDKSCRYCHACSLLIVPKDQLEAKLATKLLTVNPAAIGNGYEVIGTLDREEWEQVKQEPLSFEQVVEYLHDFNEVVTFERVPLLGKQEGPS